MINQKPYFFLALSMLFLNKSRNTFNNIYLSYYTYSVFGNSTIIYRPIVRCLHRILNRMLFFQKPIDIMITYITYHISRNHSFLGVHTKQTCPLVLILPLYINLYCIMKKYFIIDQQIVRYFVHYSEILTNEPSQMQLK